MMAGLIAAGAFCVIHRGVSDFDQTVNDVTVQNGSLPKRNAGRTDARGDPENCGCDRTSHMLGLLSAHASVGDQELLAADACDDRIVTSIVAQNISDGDLGRDLPRRGPGCR